MSKDKKIKELSFALKLIIVLAVTAGVLISYKAEADAYMGGKVVLMYFTIQSNILIALISFFGAANMIVNKKLNRFEQVMKLVGTISITLTGVVFWAVLAPSIGKEAFEIQNILTHIVVPLLAVVDFFINHKRYEYKYVDSIFTLIPPILYLIYTIIGYKKNWQFSLNTNYPYFFMNWGSEIGVWGISKEEPYMGTMWWIVLILIFLILVSLLYIKIIKSLNKNKKHKKGV